MHLPIHFGQMVLCSPFTHLTARVALALVVMLALAACERDKPEPMSPSEETNQSSVPFDTGTDELATTLGGPLEGLTPEELARFEAGRLHARVVLQRHLHRVVDGQAADRLRVSPLRSGDQHK